jgi:DNA-binding NarL/FixJ family response regulator
MGIRLVVVDGHTLHRFGLTQLVRQHADIHTVGEASTAAEAVELISRLQPDVVTVDVALPDGNGLTLARELRDRWNGLGIVVLTSFGQDDVLFRAMETGVSAFVPKTAPTAEIVSSIRHAAVAASSFTASGLVDALGRLREARDRSPLSPRETEVLRHLHRGLTIPELARALLVSTSTAKTYVARVYEKLSVNSRGQALVAAMERGLIQQQPLSASLPG